MSLKIIGRESSSRYLNDLTDISKSVGKIKEGISTEDPSKASFGDHLMDSIKALNKIQVSADQLGADVASGKSTNIQEAMISLSHAQLNFNLMVQVRNKALEAYQEMMRMQV